MKYIGTYLAVMFMTAAMLCVAYASLCDIRKKKKVLINEGCYIFFSTMAASLINIIVCIPKMITMNANDFVIRLVTGVLVIVFNLIPILIWWIKHPKKKAK